MKGFFRKLFNIYPGEGKSAILFALLGFLWAFGATSGLKFADALFLLHVGAEHLPTVYKFTACIMIFLAAFLLYAFHEILIHKIFILSLIVGIIFYTAIEVCLWQDIGVQSGWIWYALRIFGWLFFAVVLTSYWTFVDHYYHLQDAKRLYSLFSSTVFIGIACTGALMNSGCLTFPQVILLILVILSMTIGLILYITKTLEAIHDEYEHVGNGSQTETSWLSQLKSALSSRFTLLLMTGNFLTYVLLVITEYNYMFSFDTAFEPQGVLGAVGNEQNEMLTQFLGRWIAIVSISNLIFGLFLYSRLVRRFGISSLVVCTPLILLITFSGWTVSPSLLFPIMGLFVVEGTLYVIDDSNFNLLLNAVPSKLKYKIRLIIESFFEPVGMLISSFILSQTWIDSRVLGLILSGCLLIVAFALKANYLKGIYRNLMENAIHFQRKIGEWYSQLTDKESRLVQKRLFALIQHNEEPMLSLGMRAILDFQKHDLTQKLLRYVDRLDSHAKIACIHVLSKNHQGDCQPLIKFIQGWIDEQDPKLLGAIYFYLAERNHFSPQMAKKYLDSDHLQLKGAAILSLKKAASTDSDRNFVNQQITALLASPNESEICMGLSILPVEGDVWASELVMPFLKSTSPVVAREAAASMAKIASPECSHFAPALISMLTASNDTELRLNCLQALSKINHIAFIKEIIVSSIHFRPVERRKAEDVIASMGPDTVPLLLEMVQNTQLHDRCRLLPGRILGRLALPLLREKLHDLINKEVERAYFYFYYSQTVQKDYPEFDLHILQDALLTGYHSVIDFMIQLLGIAGEIEDCELLSRSLHSPHPKVRGQGLEMLERSCETPIFRMIAPLISDIPKEEKLKTYRKKHPHLLSLADLLDNLEHSSISVDQIVASTLKCHLNMPNWRSSLMKHLSLSKTTFHPFAHELLET